jgi:hypothetical protein
MLSPVQLAEYRHRDDGNEIQTLFFKILDAHINPEFTEYWQLQ